MKTGFKKAPELITITGTEKAQLLGVVQALRIGALQVFHVQFVVAPLNKRTEKFTLMKEMHPLRW